MRLVRVLAVLTVMVAAMLLTVGGAALGATASHFSTPTVPDPYHQGVRPGDMFAISAQLLAEDGTPVSGAKVRLESALDEPNYWDTGLLAKEPSSGTYLSVFSPTCPTYFRFVAETSGGRIVSPSVFYEPGGLWERYYGHWITFPTRWGAAGGPRGFMNTAVDYGKSTWISSIDGSGTLSNTGVVVQRSYDKYTWWPDKVPDTMVSAVDASGTPSVRYTLHFAKYTGLKQYYRFVDPVYDPSWVLPTDLGGWQHSFTSNYVEIFPNPWVSKVKVTGSKRAGRKFWVSGYVKPKLPAGSKVIFLVYRKGHPNDTYREFTGKTKLKGSKAIFKIAVRINRPGTYYVRTVTAPTDQWGMTQRRQGVLQKLVVR
jgi:hypothetical protein